MRATAHARSGGGGFCHCEMSVFLKLTLARETGACHMADTDEQPAEALAALIQGRFVFKPFPDVSPVYTCPILRIRETKGYGAQ